MIFMAESCRLDAHSLLGRKQMEWLVDAKCNARAAIAAMKANFVVCVQRPSL